MLPPRRFRDPTRDGRIVRSGGRGGPRAAISARLLTRPRNRARTAPCYRGRVEPTPATIPAPPRRSAPLTAWWLGRVPYREAWDLQHRLSAARADGRIGDQLLLLEHEAVLTIGRHGDAGHVRVPAPELQARGIELIRVERGGEVTYHGPGQLVAYPIVSLTERGLLVRPFVRALEAALVDTCAGFSVEADRRDGFPGCWCDPGAERPRKIGALGVRVERGVSYHGIALNVTVRLADFDLIDACGMPEAVSTSIARERGEAGEPTTESVARAAALFAQTLAGHLPARLDGELPPSADPKSAREAVEALATYAAVPSGRR